MASFDASYSPIYSDSLVNKTTFRYFLKSQITGLLFQKKQIPAYDFRSTKFAPQSVSTNPEMSSSLGV